MYIMIKTRVTDEKVFQNKFNNETPYDNEHSFTKVNITYIRSCISCISTVYVCMYMYLNKPILHFGIYRPCITNMSSTIIAHKPLMNNILCTID